MEQHASHCGYSCSVLNNIFASFSRQPILHCVVLTSKLEYGEFVFIVLEAWVVVWRYADFFSGEGSRVMKGRTILYINWISQFFHRCISLIVMLYTILKLYCRYEYTRPYMINRIWSLKQLWLLVNGHAWFHLHGVRWPVRNGEGAKNSKWKYMFPARFEPTPRQSTTGKSAP